MTSTESINQREDSNSQSGGRKEAGRVYVLMSGERKKEYSGGNGSDFHSRPFPEQIVFQARSRTSEWLAGDGFESANLRAVYYVNQFSYALLRISVTISSLSSLILCYPLGSLRFFHVHHLVC